MINWILIGIILDLVINKSSTLASYQLLDKDPCLSKPFYGKCEPIKPSTTNMTSLKRYTFDNRFGTCVSIQFTGCLAGPNLFENIKKCKRACQFRSYKILCDLNRCQDPLTTACFNDSDKTLGYYFSIAESKCLPFQISTYRPKCLKQHFLNQTDCNKTCRCKHLRENNINNRCLTKPIWKYHKPSNCTNHDKKMMWSFSPVHSQCLSYSICLKSSTTETKNNLYGNIFSTKKLCDETCSIEKVEDICKQPYDKGITKYVRSRYYYDIATHTCKTFIYKGALGNYNRFLTEKECLMMCGDLRTKQMNKGKYLHLIDPLNKVVSFNITKTRSKFDEFNKPSDHDFCLDSVTWETTDSNNQNETLPIWRYSYNRQAKQCLLVSISERGANSKNTFPNKEICDDVCTKRQINKNLNALKRCKYTQPKSICSQSKMDYFWVLDKSESYCQPKEYCAISTNNQKEPKMILDQRECQQICIPTKPKLKDYQDICSLPLVVNRTTSGQPRFLKDLTTRWSYDSEKSSCNSFVDSPSRIGNNFDSQTKCLKFCEPRSVKDICMLPIDRGVCESKSLNYTLYSFDFSIRKCIPINYSGCLGNKNKFNSLLQCQAACEQLLGNKGIYSTKFSIVNTAVFVFLSLYMYLF